MAGLEVGGCEFSFGRRVMDAGEGYQRLRKAALGVVAAYNLASIRRWSDLVPYIEALEKALDDNGDMPHGFGEFMKTDVGKEFFPNLR